MAAVEITFVTRHTGRVHGQPLPNPDQVVVPVHVGVVEQVEPASPAGVNLFVDIEEFDEASLVLSPKEARRLAELLTEAADQILPSGEPS